MSNNKHGRQRGGGNVPAPVSAPSPDAARVGVPAASAPSAPSAPAAAPAAAAVLPETAAATVDDSGTKAPFAAPFEPQAGMPPAPSLNDEAAKGAEERAAKAKADAEAEERDAREKAEAEKAAEERAAREGKADKRAAAQVAAEREQAWLERTVDPSRKKPIPDDAVMVRALKGVVVRVQHRQPGERFWMLECRPAADKNPLSQYAEEFEDRGDVEIL